MFFFSLPIYTMAPTKNDSESSRPLARKVSTQRQRSLTAPKPKRLPKILKGLASNICLPVFNLLISRIAYMSLRSPVEIFFQLRRSVSHVPTVTSL